MFDPIVENKRLIDSVSPIIVDNKEQLVQIKDDHPRIFTKPMYFEQQISGSLASIYLREGVYEKLQHVLQLLPKEYSLILYDGFRPFQVQQNLFHLFLNEIKRNNPTFSEKEIINETLKYVAYPSFEPDRISPHLTGGAIDLTLGNVKGDPLDLGTAFDELSEKSVTRYFEDHLDENVDALQNRRLLYNCMTAVGFANYLGEWWHYDYGNIQWARRMGEKKAQYGGVEVTIENNLVKEFRFR
ncbi:M15 family metallopeptidase [Lysinibacillus halotolerans]